MKLSKGFYFSIGASFLWAVYIILLRFALIGGENPYNAMFWIILIALPFWSAIFWSKRQEMKKLTGREYKILIGMALIGGIGATLSEIFALRYGQAANYSFLIRTIVLFTFVFAFIFLKEKFTRAKLALALVIIGGAYLLTANGAVPKFTLGDLFTVMTAMFLAFGNNILGKIAITRMSARLSAAASMLIAFLPALAINYCLAKIKLPENLSLMLAIGTILVIITILRFNAYKYATASYVTTVYSLTPVFVTLMAIPFLKEQITVTQLAGGLLIVGASAAATKLKI